MPRQLFRPDDVFLFRRRLVVVPEGVVEGQHDEGAVDGDRLGTIVAVEHHSPAEPPHSELARLLEDRIRPNVGHAGRRLGFRGGIRSGERFVQVPGSAPGQTGQTTQDSQAADGRREMTASDGSTVSHRVRDDKGTVER